MIAAKASSESDASPVPLRGKQCSTDVSAASSGYGSHDAGICVSSRHFQEYLPQNRLVVPVMLLGAVACAQVLPAKQSSNFKHALLQVPRWRLPAAPVALKLPAFAVDTGAVDAGIFFHVDQERTLRSLQGLQQGSGKVLSLSLPQPLPSRRTRLCSLPRFHLQQGQRALPPSARSAATLLNRHLTALLRPAQQEERADRG